MEFSELKKYAKANKKWNIEKFNNAKEVCKMIDFLNQEREQELEKELGDRAKDVSKWFVNNMNKTYFFLNLDEPGHSEG